MSILVTGAAGFFGSAIVRMLALSGHDVIAFDRTEEAEAQVRPDTPGGRVRYLSGDVTNRHSLDPARFAGVTGIVHAAALSLPDEVGMAEAILDVNVGGTINVIALATRLSGCAKMLYVSSAGVYDLTRPGRLDETDATGGRSLYAATKIASEGLMLRIGEVLAIDVGVVRPTSLWGPGEIQRTSRPFTTPLQQLVDHARRGEAVHARGLDAQWDWIYVDDAAEGLVRFFERPMGGRCLTLASGLTRPFSDVVADVVTVFGLRTDPAGAVVECAPDRPAVLSIDALVSATDWRPPMSMTENLVRYQAFLQH
jgi:UDP-glucose 4-epimerase